MSFVISEGAICAKVRNLYGKRITEKQFLELCYKGSLMEIVSFLKSSPLYRSAFESISESEGNIKLIETTLEKGLLEAYQRLCRFAGSKSMEFFSYFILSNEITHLAHLVKLMSFSLEGDFFADFPSYFEPYSSLDFNGLYRSSSFDELLKKLEGTLFYSSLSSIPTDELKRPSYAHCVCMLRKLYHNEIKRSIRASYKGKMARELLELFEQELELSNLAIIAKIKKQGDELSPREIKALLCDVNVKISPKALDSLISSKSSQELFDQIKKTSYKLEVSSLASLEIASARYISSLSKKSVIYGGNNPALCLSSYLTLRQNEISNLKAILNGISKGKSAEEIRSLLIF